MAKRFTESAKWADPWFRKLPAELKLGWFYLLDNCDGAGVVELDPELAEFQIGARVDWDSLFKIAEGRIEPLGKGKHWLTGFIKYQYGSLSEDCRAHKPVFASLEKHRLSNRVFNGYSTGIQRVQDKDKDKDKEQDKDSEGGCKGETKLEAPELICGSKRLAEAAGRWLKYKKERKESYTPTGLQAFYSRLDNVAHDSSPSAVIAQIDKAMSNDWKGWEHGDARGSPKSELATAASHVHPETKRDPSEI